MASSSTLKGFHFTITSDYAHFRDPLTLSFHSTLIGPPKPTISGILGAAIGLDEKATIELNHEIKTGLRILRIGGFAKEIALLKNLKTPPTMTPIMRRFVTTPEYQIFIASTDSSQIERSRSALEGPVYPFYLGNTECLAWIKEISQVMDVKPVTRKIDLYDCVIPMPKGAKATVRTDSKESQAQVLYPPQTYRTVHSYKWTKRGRDIESFIRLLMFTGCKVELEKGRADAFDYSGEIVCLY
jgi:CRISPR-associated protein Cas5 subtype I-B